MDTTVLYDVTISYPDHSSVLAFEGKTISEIEALIQNFEESFVDFEEMDLDDDEGRTAALNKMLPFTEGCNVSIQSRVEGSPTYLHTGSWEEI